MRAWRTLAFLLLCAAPLAAQVHVLRGETAWRVDGRGRVFGTVPDAPACLDVRLPELEGGFEPDTRVLGLAGDGWTVRATALAAPDVLVVAIEGEAGPRSVRMRGAQLDAEHGLLLRQDGEQDWVACHGLVPGQDRPRLVVPGVLVLARGRNGVELRDRLRRFAPAAAQGLARRRTLDALWLRSALQLRTDAPVLERAYRRALLQLAMQLDQHGELHVFDAEGQRTTPSPHAGLAVHELTTLVGSPLLRERLGELRPVTEPALQQPWTGYRVPVQTLRDLALARARVQEPFALGPGLVHGPSGRPLCVVAPQDPRVSALIYAFDVHRVPVTAESAPVLARAKVEAFAELWRSDGWLGVRGRWPGRPPALEEPGVVATLGLAAWRQRRGDVDGAYTLLRRVAERCADRGFAFAWEASSADARERLLSAEAAALFGRLLIECFARQDGERLVLALPEALRRAELDGLVFRGRRLRLLLTRLRHGIAVTLSGETDGLLVQLPGREAQRLGLAGLELEIVPPEAEHDPGPWPDFVRDYEDAGPADRAQVAALAAAFEALLGRELRVLLARGAPGPDEASRRARDHEAWLRRAERSFEARRAK